MEAIRKLRLAGYNVYLNKEGNGLKVEQIEGGAIVIQSEDKRRYLEELKRNKAKALTFLKWEMVRELLLVLKQQGIEFNLEEGVSVRLSLPVAGVPPGCHKPIEKAEAMRQDIERWISAWPAWKEDKADKAYQQILNRLAGDIPEEINWKHVLEVKPELKQAVEMAENMIDKAYRDKDVTAYRLALYQYEKAYREAFRLAIQWNFDPWLEHGRYIDIDK